MADTKKNALAELAKDLNAIADFANGGYGFTAIIKAKRIVAELAKVGDGRWVKDYAGWFYVCRPESRVVETVVGKCLAIAEEGDEDGK